MTSPHSPDPRWRGHVPGSREYRRVIIALVAAGIAAFSQLYAAQGMLPSLARDMGITEPQAALSVSAATGGLALAVLPWSIVADRLGRQRTLTIAMIAAVVLGVGVSLAPDYAWLLALRAAQGAAIAGIPATAMAYLSEELTPAGVATAAGLFVSGNTVGGLSGRLIAGPLGELVSWQIGFGAVTLVAAAAAVAFILAAPPSLGFVPERASRGTKAPPGSQLTFRAKLGAVLRSRHLLALYGQALLLMGGFVAVYNYLGFRLEAPPLLVAPALTSLVFIAYLAGTFASPKAGRLALRFGRLGTLLGGTALMLAGLALTLITWLPAIIAGMVVFTAGFFVAHAVASGWISTFAPTGRAQATALYNLGYYGGSSVFGWAVGLAFAPFGWPGIVVSVAVLALVAAGWAWLVLRPGPGDRLEA
ncbi:MFS transporter [Zhihengliuella salsuginis]|uniref:MFS transporter n=1 Tax=Zhihengliuella salsuginis TaxID=578222 RepID=A0ABQ3GKV3_9MICC|nr:MFS transporter [Zhihengliuella salsuginis]GHD13263.1 MFS transporter [Zhihengliuella salsuginis]